MAVIGAVKRCCTRLTGEINKWLNLTNSQRYTSYTIHPHVYDCLVIGAGGAGLRAAIGMAQEQFSRVIVSRVYPSRSHRTTTQGDIHAAMGYAANGKKIISVPALCALPQMPQRHRLPSAADEKIE